MIPIAQKHPLWQSVAVGQKALGKGHFSPCSLPAATAKICSFTSNNGPWKTSTATQTQHPLQPNNQRLMPRISRCCCPSPSSPSPPPPHKFFHHPLLIFSLCIFILLPVHIHKLYPFTCFTKKKKKQSNCLFKKRP